MKSRAIKVLVIEDDREWTNLLREMLSKEKDSSFIVEDVSTLRKGLDRLDRGGIDVVLLDLSLPDSKGLNTLVKVHAQVPEVPILVLTGLVDETAALEAVRKGAQDYLLKGQVHAKMLSRIIRYTVERIRTEETFRQSEQQNQFIFENLPTTFYRVKASGDYPMLFISDNIRLMTGYKPENFLKRPSFFTKHIHPEDRKRVAEIFSSLVEDKVQTCEFRWRVSDGTYRWFRDIVKRIRGANGTTPEIIGLCEDITEQKRSEGRLMEEKTQSEHLAKELDRALHELKTAQEEMLNRERALATGELAGGVAHEIRNPLSIISMSVQYLQSKFDPKDPRREFTEAIVRKVERLDSITKRLTSFGRYRELQMRRRSLNRILIRAVSLIKIRCKSQRIALVHHYRPLPLTMVDEELMDEVFTNLLTNAVEAMPRGGKLTLATSYDSERDEVMIKISDTGKGIPGKNKKMLFKPFFSTKKKEGGTGLGLVITQRIVTEHGGTIVFENRVSGARRGTTFTILLPVRKSRAHTSAPAQTSAPAIESLSQEVTSRS